MTGGVSYNIPVHHFEQQAPIQNAQDQWTYPGMAHAVYIHCIICEDNYTCLGAHAQARYSLVQPCSMCL